MTLCCVTIPYLILFLINEIICLLQQSRANSGLINLFIRFLPADYIAIHIRFQTIIMKFSLEGTGKFLGKLHLLLIFSLFTQPVSATAQEFGNWVTGAMDDNEGFFAATVNDSNSIFGQYCYSESGQCLWLLAVNINCEDGSRYPVLINGDGGSAQLEIVCRKLGDKPRYVFSNFDTINNSVKSSKKYIGFAFPLESGLFEVNRFLLDGAAESIRRMKALSDPQKKKKSSGNTSSYKL